MEREKTKFEGIITERKKIEEQLQNLANTETVKEYLKLCRIKDELEKQQNEAYIQMKFEDFASCNHVWINTFNHRDIQEGHSYKYYGCVKCGLDRRVFYLLDSGEELNFDQSIMHEFMSNHSYNTGIYTNLLCDFDLAKAVYAKIMEAHPDIDDETAIKYLNVAINDIKNIEVSDERKKDRAKRLSLKS